MVHLSETTAEQLFMIRQSFGIVIDVVFSKNR
jgi:hypothetical protein